MKMNYSDMIKSFADKNCINENEAKKIFKAFDKFITDYLADVGLNEENIIFPLRGLRMSSKRVKRKNSADSYGGTVIINADFNENFRKKLNHTKDIYDSFWFLWHISPTPK